MIAKPAFSVRVDCLNCAQELQWDSLSEDPQRWEHTANYSINCNEADVEEVRVNGKYWDI